jgi:ribosomal protein L40E
MVRYGRKPVDVGLPRLHEVKVKKRHQRFPDEKLEKDSRYHLLIRKVGEKKVICSCTISGDLAERIIAEAKSVKLFCRYCGAENKDDAVFCEKCGNIIAEPKELKRTKKG